jgi:multidrug efflux system membrane fusion protein
MNDPHRPDSSAARQTRDAPPESLTSRLARLSPRNRRLLTIVGAVLALALLARMLTPGGDHGRARQGRTASGGPMPVAVAAVASGDMPITFQGLGTVTPLATVTVQTQIAGQIVAIRFKEGQMVKKGDPLIEIDPRPYQVALEQAEGALARDEALLNNARLDLKRYQTLFEQDSIAEQQLATQRATVLQDEGTVKTDHAAIDAANLNLAYCHITSPVDGLAGLQQVNLGNYVTPGMATGLLVVTQLQPITVVFPLPEDQIQQVLEQLHQGHALAVTAYDRRHQTRLATGTMSTVDSQIDTATGTLKLKARFPNADLRLFPNQFVNVDLLLSTLRGANLVPQAAILRGAPGTYVYVVGGAGRVSVRKVTLGPGNAVSASVSAGLTTGELVVVDGADRLKEGAAVLARRAEMVVVEDAERLKDGAAVLSHRAGDAGASADAPLDPVAVDGGEHRHRGHSSGGSAGADASGAR